MKKITFLFLILFISQQTFAQTNFKEVQIGFTSSIGAFDLTETFVSRDVPQCIEGCSISGSKASVEFTIGVKSKLKISEFLWISSGISYSRNSYYEEFTGSTGASFYTNMNKRNFHFLNIPFSVNTSIYSFADESLSLYSELGVINHINMTRNFPDPDSDIKLERYGLSSTAGAGLRFSQNKYIFEVGPYFNHSLTNFGSDVNSNSSGKFKPYSVGLNISALIKL